jgi:hypothetical protein
MLFYISIWDIWMLEMYFTKLFKLFKKHFLVMIRQLCPQTVFVIFTSVESKWFFKIKCLYDLNIKKLGFNIPFDKLKPKHVADLIWWDPITNAWNYDHCMKCFCTLCIEDSSIFWTFTRIFLCYKIFKV